ncbi:ATPase [Virgisporangium aliadipatigenens]|uniref:ATPase n=1 Tax=Virgisporangium aliadipatigenens TaxID=741659 RepID=A0A8J3YQP2_9ACTN|nr:cation-transporting P-type ATPase [Virgisporangium aliadipatigenens]GIJ48126.1 ATPase [Virgisporangium aliadipatigenens]
MASDLRTHTADRGLSEAQAQSRLEVDGPNALPAAPHVPAWRRVSAQLRDPLILVLLVAIALTVATGDWTDAAVIALVIVVNTSVGVAQEIKADRAIAALAGLTAPEARVLRDGGQRLVPAAEVVVGDVLVLAEGDIVAADATVAAGAALLVDEAALTGESVPVDKDAGDTVSAGTVVVRGRGVAEVVATGAASAMGRIAALMSTRSQRTPLQRRLMGVGRALAVVAVVLCTVVLVLGLLRGESVELMAVTAISLVVAAVPESLPAVVTLALALGARRMAARRALVRRLPAVETLGSVTVLATDKTGTLTEGSMAVRLLWTPVGEGVVDGNGYAPHGTVRRAGRPVNCDGAPDLAGLLRAALLCSDAELRAPDTPEAAWTALGDPTEAALVAAAPKLGLAPGEVRASLPRIDERPFDSVSKRMTTVHRRPDGGVRVICKGAPEVLLHPRLLYEPTDLIELATAKADELATHGYRVLAVTAADHDTDARSQDWDAELRLVGLIGIQDPARPAAAGTIAACRDAGITPVLITGDHPATARAVAVDAGVIPADGEVVDCRRLVAAGEDGMRRARVFARATPEQKLDIISARQRAGDIVAMTGDGVNDGPALRRADIGVAMGKRGTEVARQAADLVLADDDLGTLVAAAEEGRRVYANIRRFLLYALSGGAAEIAVMLAGPFLGLPLVLLPAQILWVNLLTHGLPGVAMGGEPAPPDVMRNPPRPPAESVLGAGLWQRVLRVGAVIAALTLGVAVWAEATGRPWQSMAFFTLGATQLAVALGSRARPGSRTNPMLPVAVAGALALQLAGLYAPVLNDLLGTVPVALPDLLVVGVLSGLGYAAIRLDRLVRRSSS